MTQDITADMTDEQIVEKYVEQNPQNLPANNARLRESVNSPNYVDRGMWGPYGGKEGTISQLWIDEYRSIVLGDSPSEISLMTIIPPPQEADEE